MSGRTYPVDIRYRPYSGDEADPGDDRDEPQAIVDAVTELLTEGDGDVLVFCSGEREIREACDALRDQLSGSVLGLEVLPLYARLSAADQHRIFAAHTGTRVVVSTNVAETSLTVPGIRYVVDTGLARIARYSLRTKVQRLPIEPISQASATQRAGRSGRLAPGVAIRLYGEVDHDGRPEFTEPEVRRTNLASVLLQLTSLGIDDVEELDWLDPPDPRQVKDGLALLEELGAVDEQLEQDERGRVTRHRRLTDVGRTLARLPVDPRLGRMLLEADRLGCLDEVRAVVAGLSIIDVRQRPSDDEARAELAHRRFRVEGSDLLTRLALWRYLRSRRESLSSSAFRRMCLAEHLHHARVREWFDLDGQLRQVCKEAGLGPNGALRSDDEPRPGADASAFAEIEAGVAETVHRAMLPGLLSHIGFREGEATDYLGARGARFSVAPGSVLPRPRPAGTAGRQAGQERRPALGDGHRARRDGPAVRPRLRGHRAGLGRAGRRVTWSAGRTPSRAGTPRAGRSRRPRRSRCTASRSWPRGPSATPASTRVWRASCSSATPWSSATGSPGTRSSPPTRRSWPRSARSRSGPAGATWSSTTPRSTPSTTPGSPRTSCRRGTSTPGGSRPATGRRTC